MLKFNIGTYVDKDGNKVTCCTGGSMPPIDKTNFSYDVEFITYPDTDSIMKIDYHSDKYVSVSGRRYLADGLIDLFMKVPPSITGKTLAARVFDALSAGWNGSRMTAQQNIDLAVKENRLHKAFYCTLSLTETVHGRRFKTLDKFRSAVYRTISELGNGVRNGMDSRTEDCAGYVNNAITRFFEEARAEFLRASVETARNPKNYTGGIDELAGKEAVDALSNARAVYDAALAEVERRALETAVKELTDDPVGDADTMDAVVAELRKVGIAVVSRFGF